MKIKNSLIGILIGTLILVTSIGMTSCANSGKDKSQVWGTYSTAKVTKNLKDEVPYEKTSASINLQMMKNETEDSQFIITAGEKAINSYSLTTTDLKDSKGNVISKDSVNVYHQKYIEVNSKTDLLNENYTVGDLVPDMLLPLDIAKEYGENTIEANTNQGVTVEVKTTSNTVPGIYKGTFVLDLDGKKKDIPVSVEVWDIEYEGRRTFMSSFLLYRGTLINGEYEISQELVDRYIDFFLDYKVDSYAVRFDCPVDEFVDEAKRFWSNNNFNSICIPNGMVLDYKADAVGSDKSNNKIVEYIVALAKASTPETPYVDALYIYPSTFDEVDYYPEKYEAFEKVFKVGGEWDKTLQIALARVKETNEYKAFDAEFKAHVDNAILSIPAVNPQTSVRNRWIEDSSATFCPVLNLLNEDGNLQKYQEYSKVNNNGKLWSYTCVGPVYPHPTFHIDDYNLGTRVSGWMCKKFNIDGYLYWASNSYQTTGADLYREVNPYETAERAAYCAGDGWLVYPGRYYGSQYPFASTRLVAWRDAMDDYDMLCVYENLLNEKSKKYGITINFEDYVNDLYDSLFAGTHYYNDDSIVFKAKEELAKRILALKGEDNFIAKLESGKAVVYSTNAKLTIDGKEVNGVGVEEGYKYEITNSGNSKKIVNVKSENGEYVLVIRATSTAVSFNTSSKHKFANGMDSSSVVYEDGKATVNIVSVIKSADGTTIDGATQRFIPYVQFDATILGGRAISFVMGNTGATDIKFTLRAVLEDGTAKKIGTGFLFNGATREFRYDFDAETFTEDLLGKVKGIRFEFANVNEDATELEPSKTFTLSNFTCEIE